ncbi:TrkH family potassium uptake protein [Fusobacterium sp. PH5-44]|uniref:TrkH family potassium uptake protein n=1 Tax=unclassified Fusobacterium TaxID=2648384 RepID=UPI003D24DBB4
MNSSYIKITKHLTISRKIIIGFLFAIIIGTLLLQMPFALVEGEKLLFLDSLFTIVSGICVTGLSVIDISKVLNPTGHFILAFFIQLGGIGVMTFSSILLLVIGRKMTYKEREIIKEERNAYDSGEIGNFVKNLIMIVLIIELIGAIFYTYEFSKEMSMKKAIYFGIFHSISAFCNAGFSLFTNGFEKYTTNIIINFTTSSLVMIGGIGFSVIYSLLTMTKKRMNRFNLTLKMAIIISLILTVLGTILFLLLEYNNPTTLGNLNFFEKLLVSFFQSVTLRTAGFNTVQLWNLKAATIFMSSILMFIGASPGSTGGGIKTTTFGVLVFYVLGIIRKKEHTEVFNRSISWSVINKAVAIILISIVYISTIIMLILIFDIFRFEQVVYEVFSAFGTVGLSMGITTKLNLFSRILIMITMFVGRLGPLTFALALGEQQTITHSRYPKENILIG